MDELVIIFPINTTVLTLPSTLPICALFTNSKFNYKILSSILKTFFIQSGFMFIFMIENNICLKSFKTNHFILLKHGTWKYFPPDLSYSTKSFHQYETNTRKTQHNQASICPALLIDQSPDFELVKRFFSKCYLAKKCELWFFS